jgi:hypothetical protein
MIVFFRICRFTKKSATHHSSLSSDDGEDTGEYEGGLTAGAMFLVRAQTRSFGGISSRPSGGISGPTVRIGAEIKRATGLWHFVLFGFCWASGGGVGSTGGSFSKNCWM